MKRNRSTVARVSLAVVLVSSCCALRAMNTASLSSMGRSAAQSVQQSLTSMVGRAGTMYSSLTGYRYPVDKEEQLLYLLSDSSEHFIKNDDLGIYWSRQIPRGRTPYVTARDIELDAFDAKLKEIFDAGVNLNSIIVQEGTMKKSTPLTRALMIYLLFPVLRPAMKLAIQMLVAKGADVNLTVEPRESPLYWARNDDDLAALLIEAGADVDVLRGTVDKTVFERLTALSNAIKRDNALRIKKLEETPLVPTINRDIIGGFLVGADWQEPKNTQDSPLQTTEQE